MKFYFYHVPLSLIPNLQGVMKKLFLLSLLFKKYSTIWWWKDENQTNMRFKSLLMHILYVLILYSKCSLTSMMTLTGVNEEKKTLFPRGRVIVVIVSFNASFWNLLINISFWISVAFLWGLIERENSYNIRK